MHIRKSKTKGVRVNRWKLGTTASQKLSKCVLFKAS